MAAWLTRLCAPGLVLSTIACGGGSDTPTALSPTPSPAATFSLSGRVTTANLLVPIAGATLSIIDGPNRGRSAATDESGLYAFSGLQESGFTIIASAANYVSQSRGVTLTSNQTLNVALNQPPPVSPPPLLIVLTGQVTDATTSAPIAGAVVSINGRYRTTTDPSGRYTDTGLLDGGEYNFTYVSAAGYVNDYHYIRGTSQNVRLYRRDQITAGDSKTVTVAADDSLCVNNYQDTPGLSNEVCRSVFVVAPFDGTVTVEAVSIAGNVHPPLEVETVGVSPCCSERMGNPTSIRVAAGTEIVVNIERVMSSVGSQSFVVNTSISQ